MPSPAPVVAGRDDATQELYYRVATLGPSPFSIEQRTRALDRFVSLRSGREKPGRFWRVHFESIAPEAGAIDLSAGNVRVENHDPAVFVCDLATAARESPELFARAFGTTGIAATKFGSLAAAFAQCGVFVHVRADHACDDPVVIRYTAPAGAAIFPWTVVLA